jgi:CubicO group peptidase (beta-lactamase class C family)
LPLERPLRFFYLGDSFEQLGVILRRMSRLTFANRAAMLPALLAAMLALPAALFAQSPDPAQLAQVFSTYQHTNTPGCAVGVDAPWHDTWTAAYGMADLEHEVANTPATVFEAGSVSKQFTAAALLLLVDRRQVSLDDNIRKYFPAIPEYERPITVRQLLNHTSGLRDWGEVEAVAGWPRTTRDYTHAHVLEIISRQKALNYPPGDAWSYTNSGYNLAAMLVERVSGMPLQAFCRREFFEPLGMASTQWRDDFRRIVPNRAIAYSMRGSEWRQDMPFEDIYGNGGLLTTVGDLLKWNSNLTTGKLDGSVFEMMQKPSTLANGQTVNYGFGLFLMKFETLAEVSHSGATAGYRAWLGRLPAKGLSVAILCNAGSANPTDYGYKLARLYLGLNAPNPPDPPKDAKTGLYRNTRDHDAIKVENKNGSLTLDGRRFDGAARFADDKMFLPNAVYGEDVWERVEAWTPADLSEFAGVYASEEAETVLRVVLENGKLVIHRRPDASFTLEPTYADAFTSPLGSVHFLRDATGKIVALSLAGSRVWDLRFTRQNSDVPAALH